MTRNVRCCLRLRAIILQSRAVFAILSHKCHKQAAKQDPRPDSHIADKQLFDADKSHKVKLCQILQRASWQPVQYKTHHVQRTKNIQLTAPELTTLAIINVSAAVSASVAHAMRKKNRKKYIKKIT